MKYEDLLPLIDALPEVDRRRVAAYAASHVTEPATAAVDRANRDTTVTTPEVRADEDGEAPAPGLAWRDRYEAWLEDRGEDWFTQQEWDVAFGSLRDRSAPRPVSFG